MVQLCTVVCVIIAWTTRVLFHKLELTSRIYHLQLQLGRQNSFLRRISYSVKKWSFGGKTPSVFMTTSCVHPATSHQILCRQNNIDQYLQSFVNAAQFVCTLNNFSPYFFSKQMYPHCLFFIYKHAAFYMEAWLCCVANTFLDKIHLYSVIAEDLGVVIINRVSSRRSLS